MDPLSIPPKAIGSSATLVTQIYKYIVELIEDGLLKFGQQLPSEPNLAKQLNVSRFSLREALQKLESEGYVIKRRGIGTFVNKPSINIHEFGFEKLHSLSGNLISQGYQPGLNEIQISYEDPEEEIRKILALGKNEKIVKIQRVRTKDGEILGWTIDYLPESISENKIEEEALGFSLYNYLEVQCGVFISHGKAELEPAICDEEISKKVNQPVGSLLTKIMQIHYKEDHTPVLYSVAYWPINGLKISVIRRR